MYDKIIIITGGNLKEDFACDFINKENNSYIIGVDKGIEFLHRHNVKPDEILGDFDSINPDIFKLYKDNDDIILGIHPCEKDNTDTQLAIMRAVELIKDWGSKQCQILVLGATGSRIDHLLANIHGLIYAYDRGIKVSLIDPNNIMYLIPEEYRIRKDSCFGRYISFFTIAGEIEMSLKGFKYSINNYKLNASNSIAVSNELEADEGLILHKPGYLLCIEAED